MSCNGWARWRTTGVAILLAAVASFGALSPNLVQARGPSPSGEGGVTETVTAARLPPQGRDMLSLIQQGGPFRHDKDGVVFGNRERLLPARNRGYYREYTVRTPGERSRGARRIVCGGLRVTVPDTCYYTDDHYASFRRIVQ